MEIESVTTPIEHAQNEVNDELREACRQFEGLFIGIIMKQGMKSGFDTEEECPGGDVFKDFAIEETARTLGQPGLFGIADMLYAQINRKPAASPSIEEMMTK